MTHESDNQEVFPTAKIAFNDWLVPHWRKYGINIIEILGDRVSEVKKVIETNSGRNAREIQDFLIHDISNLANLYFKKGEEKEENNKSDWDPAIEAESAEVDLLIKYMLDTPSIYWNRESWIDFIGSSK